LSNKYRAQNTTQEKRVTLSYEVVRRRHDGDKSHNSQIKIKV